jgi:hypothetical protein
VKTIGLLTLCSFLVACAAAQNLNLVEPYLKQIEVLESEKKKNQSKGCLSEIDKIHIEYIDIEIDRITLEVNDVSKRFEKNNSDIYETKNFYENNDHPIKKTR